MRPLRVPWIGLVVGAFGCLMLFRKLLAVDVEQWVWADTLDPNLISWIMEWGYHVLVQIHAPASFFDANMFYPLQNSLATTDSFLSAQLLYSPLRMLGVGPQAALYLTLSGAVVAGASLTDGALLRLGVTSLWERGLVVFCAHLSLPVTTFLAHYQCFAWEFAPPFFLYVLLYLSEWRRRDLAIVCALYCFATSWAIYLAPMLMSLALVLILPTLIRLLRRRQLVDHFRHRVGPLSTAMVAAFAIVLFFVQLRPYFLLERAYAPPDMGVATLYSANRMSLIRGFSIHSYWYDPGGYDEGGWERAYFPGYLLLTTLALSAVLAAVRWRKRGDGDAHGLAKGMAILCFAAWIFSTGPILKRTGIPLPFAWFAEFVPGVKNIRAPGRFGIFLGLPLGFFAVWALRQVVASVRLRTFIGVFLAAAILGESWTKHYISPTKIPKRSTYEQVGKTMPADSPLLELPIAANSNYDTIFRITEQLKGSTLHWGRMVVGYGGKSTPENDEAIALSNLMQAGAVGPEKVVEFARKIHVAYILVHLSDLKEPVRALWQKMASEEGAFAGTFAIDTSLLLRLKP